MGLFGDKSKKSWQRLSFKNKRTNADALTEEQSRSRQLIRFILLALFTVATILILGVRRTEPLPLIEWASLTGRVTMIYVVMTLLVRTYHREVLRSLPTYLVLVGLFLLGLRLVLVPAVGISPFLVPLPLLAITLAVVYNGALAVHTSLAVATVLGIMLTLDGPDGGTAEFAIAVAMTQLVGSVVAILGVEKLRKRTRPVVVGLTSGLAQMAAVLVYELASVTSTQLTPSHWDWSILVGDPVWAFLGGLASGVLFMSALPFLERWLHLTTDMRLLELSDQNRPLLRQFSLLAPGSFQHSLMVGQLAEVAAQKIGANELLARVGALYHDIGKMLKPNYFIENSDAGGENIHDRLSPEMSRLIIIAHVKDGIRIAEEEDLPKPIIDMIPMHHGTSVVEYFYFKKRQQEEQQDLGRTGNEAFQYPGPRPTFKEAGILMLADTTEAISRVLQDPTPARLKTVVQEVIRKKMADGQLDDCRLTISDLKKIEEAFVKVLASIHHGRIKYPEPQKGGDGNGKSQKGRSDDDRTQGGRVAGTKSPDAKTPDAKTPDAKGGGGAREKGKQTGRGKRGTEDGDGASGGGASGDGEPAPVAAESPRR